MSVNVPPRSGSAGKAPPLLPPMTSAPTANINSFNETNAAANNGSASARPAKLASMDHSGSVTQLPQLNSSSTISISPSTQLDPLPFQPMPMNFAPAMTAPPGAFMPFPPNTTLFPGGGFPGGNYTYNPAGGMPFFDPFLTSGAALPGQPILPIAAPTTPDAAFSNQVANRRYNLMIRAAPTTAGASHRPKKTPREQSLDPNALLALGEKQSRRPHFLQTDASVARNAARLNKMFGANSTYSKRMKRMKAREGQAELESQVVGSQSARHAKKDRADLSPGRYGQMKGVQGTEEKQAQDIAAAAALEKVAREQAAQKAKNAANQPPTGEGVHYKQRKKILAFLTSIPPKHHFFDHLPKQPTITEKHVERIYEEVGSAALGHLRILESNNSRFDSMQDLLNSIVQSELMERENRESERNREAAAAQAALLGDSEEAHAYAAAQIDASLSYRSEHDRAIAAVSQQDRDRLVAYLTSSPINPDLPDSITVKHADGTTSTMQVPFTCNLFSNSEFVSATPMELNELIVEGQGINQTLYQLIQLDTVAGRTFDNFSQCLFAMHVAELDLEVSKRAKSELMEYFKRGEELWKKEQQRKKNKEAAASKKGGAAAHVNDEDSKEQAAHSVSTKGGLKRREAGPPTCRVFLHLSSYPMITSHEIDRLYDEGCAGRDTLLHLKGLDSKNVRVNSFQHLIDLLLEVHMRFLRNNKLYMIDFTPVTRQDRNELLKFINSPDVHFFNQVPVAPANSKRSQLASGEEKEISDTASVISQVTNASSGAAASASVASKKIQATSDEVAILISEVQSLSLAMSYLQIFNQRGLKFAKMEDLIFELKIAHAKMKKEFLRFFRHSQCKLFYYFPEQGDANSNMRTGEENAYSAAGLVSGGGATIEEINADGTTSSNGEASNSSGRKPSEDADLFTMSMMDRLMIESRLNSTPEILSYLMEINDQGYTFASFHALIEFLQELSARAANARKLEKETLLKFLSSPAAHLLPRELQIFEHDVNRIWSAAGDDSLVLVYHLNDSKKSFETMEEFIGALKDDAAAVHAQKLELFTHLLSKHSGLFEKISWDPTLTPKNLTNNIRSNYYASIQEFLPLRTLQIRKFQKQQAVANQTASGEKISLYQLVEEAAAQETRNRLAMLTGQSLDKNGQLTSPASASAPSASSTNVTKATQFGTDLTEGLSVWSSPSMTFPSLSDSNGIVSLSPAEISRLYRQSLAGPLTLTYLWRLEVSNARFFRMDDLIAAVRNMHAEYCAKQSQERNVLLSELLHQSNAFLFTHPIRVTEEQVENLLKIFGEVSSTLFHLHHLRSIERSYSSFAELESEMKEEKRTSELIQRDVLAYLRHPLCYLLSNEVLMNMESIKRVFYESQTGFHLPFYLQILDGRSGGKMDLEEQRRRMRQLERERSLGIGPMGETTKWASNSSAASDDHSAATPEEKHYKFASLTELILAIKSMKNAMSDAEAKCIQFLNSGRGNLFFNEDAEAASKAMDKTQEQRRNEGKRAEENERDAPGVYTIGGHQQQSQALVPTSPLFPASPVMVASASAANIPRKVWTVYEIARLMVEGEGGVDTPTHLQSLQAEHLAYRAKIQAQQALATKAALQAGATKEQAQDAGSESAAIAVLGLTSPPTFSSIEALIQHLQAMQRQLVQQRNQDKAVLHAFVSQPPAQNALMSASFHTANHVRRGAGADSVMASGVDFHSPALALVAGNVGRTASIDFTSSLGDLDLSAGSGLSDESFTATLNSNGVPDALSGVRCIWHSDEIDALYEAGQGANVGPATLLLLVEAEMDNRHSGRKFNSVPQLIEAIKMLKERIIARKTAILEYLLEFAPRFFARISGKPSAPAAGASSSSSSTSPRKGNKKYAPASKVVSKVDTRVAVRGGNQAMSTNLANATAAGDAPPFYIPTMDDVSALYEQSGAGSLTLSILRDFELEVVGRRPFASMEELAAAVNTEYVRRTSNQRARERELEAFLTNPAGCPLFSTPQSLQRSAVQYLVGCANGDAAAAVFFIQQLLEATQGANKFDSVLELVRAIKDKAAEQIVEVGKIHSFLTNLPGRTLLYGFHNANPSNIGTLHRDSLNRLYVEGGAGASSLNYMQNYVLNQRTFALTPDSATGSNGISSTSEGPLTELIRELHRAKMEELDEFKLIKQRTFAYLRREPGSEIEGALCDLFSDDSISSSLQHLHATQPSDSTALILTSASMPNGVAASVNTATAAVSSTSASAIGASLSYTDINQLFHTAQSGKYTLEYLHTFNMELRSFSTFESLIQALKIYHEHVQKLKSQIYEFFVSPSEHSRSMAAEAAGGAMIERSSGGDSNPCRLFEASPYEIHIDASTVDQLMSEGQCGEETLSMLFQFAATNRSFQTMADVIAELQGIHADKKAKLEPHKQRILQFISSSDCQLFRQPIQITDYHLELLVEAGRKSIVSSAANGTADAKASSAASPSSSTLSALAYLNTSLHWFATPKALVIGVRESLASIMDAKRRAFKWLNNLHKPAIASLTNQRASRRPMISEEEACPLWENAVELSNPDAAATEEKKSSALAVSGRTGKAAHNKRTSSTSSLSGVQLRFTSEDLNSLFESSGAGPEAFELVRRMAASGLRFTNAADLIQASVQYYGLALSRRRELLKYLSTPSCTLFSRAAAGFVFLLTLSDMKVLLEILEEEQIAEEDEWAEENKRKAAGLPSGGADLGKQAVVNGTRPSYAQTLLPFEASTINAIQSYPYESRVLRLLKELSEVGKKMTSLSELVHVLRQSSYEMTQREDAILTFLNDTTKCKFFNLSAQDAATEGRKNWNRFHVRRLIQEISLHNSTTDQSEAREEDEDELKSEEKSQNDETSSVDLPTFEPKQVATPRSDEVYIGLGDCILLLWNLNASGRAFHSFTELLQALKTEYLLAAEYVAAQQGKSNENNGAESHGEDIGHNQLGSGSQAGKAVGLLAPKASAPGTTSTASELLVTAPTYLDNLALHTKTYAAQPRSNFSWESMELEFLFNVSYLSPALLTSLLKVKYLEWQNAKQSLLHFFKRKNNPIFAAHSHGGGAQAQQLQETLHFLQTEAGVNTIWYGSGAREYCLNYLSILMSMNRSFDSLPDLLKTLKSMHRKRMLQTKLQAILEKYESSMSRMQTEFITDAQRKIVVDFLSSPESTIFRPSDAGGGKKQLPGQEPLQVERDPFALPVIPPPQPKYVGVNLSKKDVDTMIHTAGHSVNLLLLYLRYLSKFSRTFTNLEELLPMLKQVHGEHVEMCKMTLKFFYQSDCLLLNYQQQTGAGSKNDRDSASANLLLLPPTSNASSRSNLMVSGDAVPQALSRAQLDDAEILALDLRGLNGGGSNSGVDLNLNDMSLLIRQATGGLPVLPHLQNFDAARRRFRSFEQLIQAVAQSQKESEQAASINMHVQKYTDACKEFLASPWTGLFTDTVHSTPVLPNEQEFQAMLQASAGSSTALLVNLHQLNNQGRKFTNYAQLSDALIVATAESSERKEEIWQWVRSSENKLFSHAAALPDAKHVAGDIQSQYMSPPAAEETGQPFEWTFDHVNRLYEETDAAADTLSHLYTLNTLGAKFYRFSSLVAAVVEQHEKLKASRAEAIQAARRKEGKALVRSHLLDPSTHLFSVPVSIHDGHITQLYEVGEQGETAVGIRLLGKRTRPGAATVHCLQALESMRPESKDKFSNFAELFTALQGAAINLIIERSETIGIGEVSHKPPEVLQGAAGKAIDSAPKGEQSSAAQLSLGSVGSVQPFLLSAQDKQIILEYLANPACQLFRELAQSPVRQTLAVRTSDLQEMAKAAGDGSNAVTLLKRLDSQGKQFASFEELVFAVKVEALARPPPATLTPEQSVKLLAYLSKCFLLYDRVDLSHKLSKADLIALVEVSGKSLENVICNLQDLSDNHSLFVPCTTWVSFVQKAEANWNALARLKRETLAYLQSVESDLFSSRSDPYAVLTLNAMDPFFVQSGAGAHMLTYLMSFSRAGQSFASMQELTVAVRSAHLATQNIKSAEMETEKNKVLTYLSESAHIKALFTSVSDAASGAAAPSISVTDSGLREMLKLSGSAAATIQLLNILYDKGVKVSSFEQLVNKFKQQIVQNYQ